MGDVDGEENERQGGKGSIAFLPNPRMARLGLESSYQSPFISIPPPLPHPSPSSSPLPFMFSYSALDVFPGGAVF